MNLYLYTFLIDRFFVFLTVFFTKFLKTVSLHEWTCGSFRVYCLGLKIVRLCILKQRLTRINFSFRKASVVYFLSIFIDKTSQLRKSCVNKHMFSRAETEFSICINARTKFSILVVFFFFFGKLLNGNQWILFDNKNFRPKGCFFFYPVSCVFLGCFLHADA